MPGEVVARAEDRIGGHQVWGEQMWGKLDESLCWPYLVFTTYLETRRRSRLNYLRHAKLPRTPNLENLHLCLHSTAHPRHLLIGSLFNAKRS